MEIEDKINFKIDSYILNDYVALINSIREPMNQIKEQLNKSSKSKQMPFIKTNGGVNKSLVAIIKMQEEIQKHLEKNPHEQSRVFIDIIKQIMDVNNGILSTRMIEPLNISRQYLSIMENKNMIEKASRGIYIIPNAFEDSYYSFQQKYKKAIFSHMNALYFYEMTEEFPYNYTITVPQSYHACNVNEKCNVFYVAEEIYEMGVSEVETPNGNKVRAYDKERCICDIIRSKGRMDAEQVRKSIKQYMQNGDIDMDKITEYSKKMGINEKVMEVLEGVYY